MGKKTANQKFTRYKTFVVESVGGRFLRLRTKAGRKWKKAVGDEVVLEGCKFVVRSKRGSALLVEGIQGEAG